MAAWKKWNYTRVRWCFLRHIADVWCDVGDEWCEVAGDVGNAGSKARSVSHQLKQPEGAAQGGWQWDWSWVSQLMIMKLIHVLELKWKNVYPDRWDTPASISNTDGKRRGIRWTNKLVDKKWRKLMKICLNFNWNSFHPGSCMGQQVQGWTQEKKIW